MADSIDIFALALVNTASLESRLRSLLDSLQANEGLTLEQFTAFVTQNARISINMSRETLNSFLSLGRHRNIYEWADQQSLLSGRDKEEILKEKLKDYYERRVSFDQSFLEGKAFRYGALNIGGVGLISFGDYCLVFKLSIPADPQKAAYLANDSLNYYMPVPFAIAEDKLSADLALHSHRGFLAALKHKTSVCVVPPDEWPCITCSDSGYIEAIFVECPNRDDLECVRMSVERYQELVDLSFEDYRRDLPEGERAIIGHFVMILEQLNFHNINLETL
jgi:hypothetical protein